MDSDTGKFEADKEFVRRILQGDEKAWSEFVESYTDWVFYRANKWTRRETLFSQPDWRKMQNLTSGKEYGYTGAALDAYLWIFGQLRNKLRGYKAKASLSTFVWAVLKSKKHLSIDFRRWRYSNASYLPKVIQQCSEMERKVFVSLRMGKPIVGIASEYGLSIEEVEKIKEALIEKLRAVGLEDLLSPTVVVELSDELRNVLPVKTSINGEERIQLEKVIARFFNALEKLPNEERRLLQMFYNEELTAKEILEAYQLINLSLPNTQKAIQESTQKDVFKAIEKSKAHLLPLFQQECHDLPDAVINNDTVNEFLDQLGVKSS